jgi:hypothetical protein
MSIRRMRPLVKKEGGAEQTEEQVLDAHSERAAIRRRLNAEGAAAPDEMAWLRAHAEDQEVCIQKMIRAYAEGQAGAVQETEELRQAKALIAELKADVSFQAASIQSKTESLAIKDALFDSFCQSNDAVIQCQDQLIRGKDLQIRNLYNELTWQMRERDAALVPTPEGAGEGFNRTLFGAVAAAARVFIPGTGFVYKVMKLPMILYCFASIFYSFVPLPLPARHQASQAATQSQSQTRVPSRHTA